MISEKGTNIVVDTGPDFRQQMLRNQVSTLEAVVFTHAHRDHIAGLDDVRSFNFLQKRPMDIFAEPHVIDELTTTFSYAFGENSYPGVPQITAHELSMDEFVIGPFTILPIRLFHGKLPVLGFRINDFAYLVDLNRVPVEEKLKLKGLRTLVVGALRKKPHHSHFNVDEALELIAEIGPEEAWLTHISHLMGFHAALEGELPGHVHPAYDQLVLEL